MWLDNGGCDLRKLVRKTEKFIWCWIEIEFILLFSDIIIIIIIITIIIIIIIINNLFFVGIIQHFKILQIVFRPQKLPTVLWVLLRCVNKFQQVRFMSKNLLNKLFSERVSGQLPTPTPTPSTPVVGVSFRVL